MEEKKYIIISISMMLVSGIMLLLAVFYYDLSDKVKKYSYSTEEEYNNVKEGIAFIKTLPIHFNIINKYFSNINNLEQKEKEEIVLSYAIKNNYNLYNCGPSNDLNQYLCIDKEKLTSNELLEKFNLDLNFKSKNINLYIDDYGSYIATTTENAKHYKIILNAKNNKQYRLYAKFSHYKKEKDTHIFYMYQGYYKGNCEKDSELELYDFMTGKAVYKNTCNGNKEFTIDPGKNIEKIGLYKYEQKKDKNNKYYLYGYNPVNKIEK